MFQRFSQVSYQVMKNVLVKQLKFEMAEVSGNYIFTHPQSNTLLTLPILPNQKNLTLSHYRMVFEVLDQSGIIAKKAFEALLKRESPSKMAKIA
jgi:hypothetical protein